MRSSPGKWLAGAIGVAIAVATAPALAAGERVVVATPPADPLADRVQKELQAIGLDPQLAVETRGCTRSAVLKLAHRAHAKAVVSLEEKSLCVWILHAGSLGLEEVIGRGADDDAGTDDLAVRVAEITRANLSSAEEERQPPPPPQPVFDPQEKVEEDKPPPKPEVPRVPTFLVGAGVGRMIGGASREGVRGPIQSIAGMSLSLDAALRISQFLAFTARAEIAVGTPTIPAFVNAGGDGSTIAIEGIHVDPSLFAFGLNVPLARVDSLVIPRLGAGVGFSWLHAQAGSNSTDIFSPAVYGDIALSLRVYGPLRAAVSGLLGATGHRMVALTEGTEIANWGQPFGAVDLRAEWVFE
ncbi:hypothetical protein AKJ09_03402 [Labilithrix luteola]|uniref:Flagellar hook-length control protein FliK n=1 Tax=Labilithrix luteola TaxID=1391654 RepID=A0A0K1PT80_9BACT|nr:hypothetical protein [Labilithrix luteola]AKU96738.1 hypothetical protein AKJ09_03402 [Labilithrix luteola]